MKKLLSLFISILLLLTLSLSFTACDMTWDTGPVSGSSGSSDTTLPDDPKPNPNPDPDPDPDPEPVKTPLELAIEEFDEKKSFLLSLTTPNTPKPYTFASLLAVQQATLEYVDFTTEGKTLEEIQAINTVLDQAIALLTPSKPLIDERLISAINQLSLYKTDSSGKIVYVDEYGDVCDKNTPGAMPLADKGVDKIEYNAETATATFHLTKSYIYAKLDENGNMVECEATDPEAVEYYDIKLTEFVATKVLQIFDKDFSDITSVSFKINVDPDIKDDDDTKVETDFTLDVTDGTGGMFLAAGLLAICAGFEQDLYNAMKYPDEIDFSAVLRDMQNYTYDIIKNKGCTATVTFASDKYYTSVEFTALFKA